MLTEGAIIGAGARKIGHTGVEPQLKEVSALQCRETRQLSTSPAQSNARRLRRSRRVLAVSVLRELSAALHRSAETATLSPNVNAIMACSMPWGDASSLTMPRRRPKPRRSRSVRTYVVRLVVAVTLPLLAFGAFLLVRSAHNEQQAIATTADERAEGAAADLDRELRNLQNLISIVAVSSFISDADFTPSHHGHSRLLDDRALGIVVRDLSGQPLFNTCDIDGRTLPTSKALGNSADTSHGNTKPYISDLIVDPISGASVLTIDLLIWRESKPAYILSLCAVPRIVQILIEQHLPDGWTAIVTDREGRMIASTPGSVHVRSAATGGDAAAVASAWGNDSTENVWDNSGPAYRASYPVDVAG